MEKERRRGREGGEGERGWEGWRKGEGGKDGERVRGRGREGWRSDRSRGGPICIVMCRGGHQFVCDGNYGIYTNQLKVMSKFNEIQVKSCRITYYMCFSRRNNVISVSNLHFSAKK